MAKDSALLASPPRRNLWQLPTLLLGMACLVGVWYARPYLRPTPAQRFDRELAQLRVHLEKAVPDVAAVQTQMKRIENVQPPEALAGQARFLRGSAYVVLAESSTEKEAAKLWKLAREAFESVKASDLTPSDQQRLPFRIGKAWSHTGHEPPEVIEALSKSLQCGDYPAEGYRLLAAQYMRLSPPEVKRARDALKEYLSCALPRTDPRTLNTARLKLGELYSQLGEVDDARKVLERIGPDAPADIYIAARTQLAKGFQNEEDFAAAIRVYEQARDLPGITEELQAALHYQLATCYQRTNRRPDAIAALEKARKGRGPEAQAAAIRAAELQLRDPAKRDAAAKALEGALPEILGPDQYSNTLLPLNEARAVFEEAIGVYRVGGEFELAMRVARAYTRIAEQGREKELIADIAEGWGVALAQQAQRDDIERPRLEEAAQKRFREAAIELSELLETKPAAEKPLIAKRTADLWTKAGDQARGAKLLEQFGQSAMLPTDPKVDSWFQKAEAALAAGDKGQALQAYEKALATPGTHLAKTRLQLAQLLFETNDPIRTEKGYAYLEQNLTPEVQKERDVHEKSLYLIAFQLYQRREWRKSEFRLGQAIEFYPESAQAVRARFHQGRCYWFMAAQEAKRIQDADVKLMDGNLPDAERQRLTAQKETSEKQYRESLTKAMGPFQQVESDLLRRAVTMPLVQADAQLLRQASFAAAEVAFYLGEYEECVDRYTKLQDRYAGKVEYLMAASQLWQCYSVYLSQPEKAKFLLTKMKETFIKMSDAEFDGTAESRKRDFWDKWFQQAEGSSATVGGME